MRHAGVILCVVIVACASIVVRAADGLPTDVWTCASWSSGGHAPAFPWHPRALATALTNPLPLPAWSSVDDASGPCFSLDATNIAVAIPDGEWFDRAYGVELMARITSPEDSLFVGTLKSQTADDLRGFFITCNEDESGTATGPIVAGLQRGPHYTLASARTQDGFLRTGQWHHILMVKSPRHVRLYVDGRLVASHKMVMQYSYVYPLKDFHPRVLRIEGTAEIAEMRLYDGWLHRPEAEAMYHLARARHQGCGLPRAHRVNGWWAVACIGLLGLACMACVLRLLNRLAPVADAYAGRPLAVRLRNMAASYAAVPIVALGTRKLRYILPVVLVLVVSVHEWVKLGEPTHEYRDDVLWGDYMNTDVAARDLAAGLGFRELRLQESVLPRNPLHAVHLAAVYTMFGSGGQDEQVHRVAGSVAVVIACLVLFEMLLGLVGPMPAFLGVLLFHNTFDMASQRLLSEPTAVLLLVLALHCTVLAARRQRLVAAACGGLVAGAAMLVRSYFAVLWPLTALWFLWRAMWDRGGRKFWLHAVVQFSVFFLLLPAVYSLRNLAVHDCFTTAATYQMVDPWGQHCGDTPIDFHAWQLFKWPGEIVAHRMLRHELGCHVRDFPGEFLATWREGIHWICWENLPAGIRWLLPLAIPALIFYSLVCLLARPQPHARLHVEAVWFVAAVPMVAAILLAAGHPSGFAETVPRYWHPLALCLGALGVGLVCWLPCLGWVHQQSPRRDGVNIVAIVIVIGIHAVALLCCCGVWWSRNSRTMFPVEHGFDWRGYARGVLANEGRLPSNVIAVATGTLGYPARTSYGLQADLLVRNRVYPMGEIRLRLHLSKEFVPLAGLDPESVWGRNVRVSGLIVSDRTNEVFESFCMDVDWMELLDDRLGGVVMASRLARPEAVGVGAGETFLVDMQPLVITGLHRGLVLGTTYDRQPAVVDRRYYPRSIAMHPWSNDASTYVEYALDGAYSTFSSMVWITSIGNARFMVIGDGRLLCETPYIQPTNLHICPMPQTNTPMQIGADIRGCKVLRLEIDKGFHHYSDHALWGDPRIIK